MSSFITQCPLCETSFNITQAQLKLAEGKVRCGFCLGTFSALEQQLFIEEELESNKNYFDNLNNNTEDGPDHSEDLSENNETPFEQAIEIFLEENLQESIEEDESLDLIDQSESDRDEDEELETFLPEQNQIDTEFIEEIEGFDDLEDIIDVEENISITEVPVDEEETILEEVIIEDIEVEDIDIDVDEDVDVDLDVDVDVDVDVDLDVDEDVEKLAPQDDSNRSFAKSGFGEVLLEEPEPELKLESEFDKDLEKNIETEETEETIKEQLIELDTSPITVSSAGNVKKKEELQSLDKLYDDEALNTDGSNPVNAISEEPIPIYRQYSRPAFISFALFFCNVLLITAIGAQYAWANFDNFLRESRFSALTAFVCNYANCPDVERFDLSSFSTDELIINAHPSIANALQIDFIFSNNAEFEQEFPLVELNFSDLNRRLIANRLFRPEESLEQGLQPFSHLPPNSSIQIRLEIADPGAEAINYSLMLRTP